MAQLDGSNTLAARNRSTSRVIFNAEPIADKVASSASMRPIHPSAVSDSREVVNHESAGPFLRGMMPFGQECVWIVGERDMQALTGPRFPGTDRHVRNVSAKLGLGSGPCA